MVLRYPPSTLVPNVCEPPFGAVGDGINDDGPAIRQAINTHLGVFFPPNKIFRIDGHLGMRNGARWFGPAGSGNSTSTAVQGVPKLLFVGGDGYGCIRNYNEATRLVQCGISNMGIEADESSNFSNMIDVRHMIGFRMDNVRVDTNSLTVGGIRSRVNSVAGTANQSWVNNWVHVESRVPRASTARPLDLDTSDSDILGGNFSGGLGIIMRGPGAVKFMGCRIDVTNPGTYDAATNPTGTRGAGITWEIDQEEAYPFSWVLQNCQIEENMGRGVLIHVKRVPTEGLLEYKSMGTIVGSSFRNSGGAKEDGVTYPSPVADIELINDTATVFQMPYIAGNIHVHEKSTTPGNLRNANYYLWDRAKWRGQPADAYVFNKGSPTNWIGDEPRQPPLLLAQSGTPIATGASTVASETFSLATLKIPAYALGKNDKLVFKALFTTTGAGSKTYRNILGAGGTVYKAVASTASIVEIRTEIQARDAYILQCGGPTNSFGGPAGTASGALVTSSRDMTQEQDFVVAVVIDTIGDSVTMQSYSLTVEKLPA